MRPAERAHTMSPGRRRTSQREKIGSSHLPNNRYQAKTLPESAALALSTASEIPPALPERNKIPPRNSRYQNLPSTSSDRRGWDDDVISNLHGVAIPSRRGSVASLTDDRPLPPLPRDESAGNRRSKSFSQTLKRLKSLF